MGPDGWRSEKSDYFVLSGGLGDGCLRSCVGGLLRYGFQHCCFLLFFSLSSFPLLSILLSEMSWSLFLQWVHVLPLPSLSSLSLCLSLSLVLLLAPFALAKNARRLLMHGSAGLRRPGFDL